MPESGKCWLSLGANLGERKRTLRKALELLARLPETELCEVSSFYETAPWGVKEQPDFINAAACIRTALTPEKLLDAVQSIERELGRVRKTHWGARTIDIDILHIENVRLRSERLTLPHPYWRERAFVLVPLAEIAGDLVIEDRPVREFLAVCRDNGRVFRTEGSPVDFGLRILACVDQKWGLAREGNLLFRFPEDLKRFRSATIGHTVILGRKTFESLPGGKALEHRHHLILSGNQDFMPEKTGASLHVLPDLAALWENLRREEENFVIGGAEVYRQLLPYCQEALVTFVMSDGQADLFLPDLDAREEFFRQDTECFTDAATGISMEFRLYRRNRRNRRFLHGKREWHGNFQKRLGGLPE